MLAVKDFNVFKILAFESGFKSVGVIQGSFSVHFFVIMLMFVVFDLEVVLLLALIVVDLVLVDVFFILFVFVVGGFLME